ncbi:MAG: flavodoxin family protein, partial [Candidatus Zixiibacteriota bacterium]
MANILVVYDSVGGNTERMAMLVKEGVEDEGIEADAKPVTEVHQEELLKADGVLLGSMSRLGNMSAPMKRFLDDPETGKHYSNPQGVDFFRGWTSENHMAHKTQTYLFGSHMLGRTEKYNQWKDYWNRLLDYWAKRGFIETGSGGYVIRTMGPILNVYDFIIDPVVREKAEMVLDWMWAEWAQENIKGIRGGGKVREYDAYAAWGEWDSLYNLAYVLFGTGKLTGRLNMHTILIATTNYYPPDVIIDLAVDRYGKDTYEIKERRPQYVWDESKRYNARRYVYVTPKYILGGFQSDADKKYAVNEYNIYWDGQQIWSGVIFDTTPNARIYFDDLWSPAKSFVHKNVLILSGLAFDWKCDGSVIHREAKAVFPDKVLDQIIEDAGWIFAREGDVYVAYKSIGGYTWETKHVKDRYVGKTVKSKNPNQPIILE